MFNMHSNNKPRPDNKRTIPTLHDYRYAAELLQSQNRFDAAIAKYDAALQWYPDDAANILMFKAHCLDIMRQHAYALVSIDMAIATIDRTMNGNDIKNKNNFYQTRNQTRNRYKASICKARILQNLDRYPEALQTYDALIQHHEFIYMAYHSKIICLQKMQNYSAAITTAKQALEIFKNGGLNNFERNQLNAAYAGSIRMERNYVTQAAPRATQTKHIGQWLQTLPNNSGNRMVPLYDHQHNSLAVGASTEPSVNDDNRGVVQVHKGWRHNPWGSPRGRSY